jgi:type I restriction enzyme M protein
MANHHELSNFIWQIADLLRGPYRPPQNERVMLPISAMTAKLDALRAATERTIDVLKERRAALIAAAVTERLDYA